MQQGRSGMGKGKGEDAVGNQDNTLKPENVLIKFKKNLISMGMNRNLVKCIRLDMVQNKPNVFSSETN